MSRKLENNVTCSLSPPLSMKRIATSTVCVRYKSKVSTNVLSTYEFPFFFGASAFIHLVYVSPVGKETGARNYGQEMK